MLPEVKKDVKKASISILLNKDKTSELLAQIVSDINAWADAFQLRGRHVDYTTDKSGVDEIRYYITDANTPIILVDIVSKEKSVYLVLSPIGNSGKDYDMIFQYLTKKKTKLQMYAAVILNRDVKDAHVEISEKVLK